MGLVIPEFSFNCLVDPPHMLANKTVKWHCYKLKWPAKTEQQAIFMKPQGNKYVYIPNP